LKKLHGINSIINSKRVTHNPR